jgi:hypothetical protein
METDLSEEEAMAEIRAGLQAEFDDPSGRSPTHAVN